MLSPDAGKNSCNDNLVDLQKPDMRQKGKERKKERGNNDSRIIARKWPNRHIRYRVIFICYAVLAYCVLILAGTYTLVTEYVCISRTFLDSVLSYVLFCSLPSLSNIHVLFYFSSEIINYSVI